MTDRCVVLDLGSDTIKAGLADDPEPAHVFPSLVARMDERRTFVAEQAEHRRRLSPFVTEDEIRDFDAAELLWREALVNRLRVKPSDVASVVLTEPPQNPESRSGYRCA